MIQRPSAACLALLVAAICASPACAQKSRPGAERNSGERANGSGPLPAPPLPRGFESYSAPQGSGRLIFARFSGVERSARAALLDFIGALRGYFDAPPRFVGAVGDPQDQRIQAMCVASVQGQQVRGVATVVLGGGEARFGIIFDRPNSFSASFAPLAKKLSEQMPREASANGGAVDLRPPQNWQRQTGGDGSAAASFPPGWRVTGAAKGAMDIVGPNKEYIELGLALPVLTSALPGYQGAVAPYMNPLQAWSYYVGYVSRISQMQGGPVTQLVRIVESTAVPWPQGQGAYILQDSQTQGQNYRALAVVLTSPVAANEWLLYTSYVAAPAEAFSAELPDMLRIWTSWKIDDRVFQERMQQALSSMRETNAIIQSTIENRSRVMDNVNEAWDLVIRGETRMENTDTGRRADVYNDDVDAVLRRCEQQGIACRKVPLDQLVPH